MVNGVIRRTCSKSFFTYVAHCILVNLHRLLEQLIKANRMLYMLVSVIQEIVKCIRSNVFVKSFTKPLENVYVNS